LTLRVVVKKLPVEFWLMEGGREPGFLGQALGRFFDLARELAW